MRSVRVVVSGRVQGVLFRDSCSREATTRGVRGWVRNNPDGTVEAVFSGAPDDVEAMVAWSRQGPPHAQVSDLQVEPTEEPSGTGFEVQS